MSQPVRTRRAMALLMTLMLSGCGGWNQQAVAPSTLVEENKPRLIRVTRRDSSQVYLHSPEIQGDSLRGLIRRGKPLAVPLNDIAYLSTERANAAGWVALGGLMLIGGAMIGLSVALKN